MAASSTCERLSDTDLRWLVEAAGEADLTPSELRADPRRLVELTEHPAAAASLLGARAELFPAVAPPLVFLILVSHTLQGMETRTFVGEPMEGGSGVPVFDAAELRGFARVPARRIFLADVLASFAHLESGVRWVLSDTGWRRRRYSDLDPLSIAERVADATGAERSAALRRLGDLALFLSGIFPEYATARPIEPRRLERIHRLLAAVSSRPVDGPGELLLAAGDVRGIWLLEWLGRHAYKLAVEMPDATDAPLLAEVGHRFRTARRTLNAVAAHDLGSLRGRWFPAPDG
ncbi:MAG: hypothetical protein ABSH07_09375 [Candidatus Dormibacteria bacterium]|jgi:hypothetical protein